MMQLNRNDPARAYMFSLHCHLFPMGTVSVLLSSQAVSEENCRNTDFFFLNKTEFGRVIKAFVHLGFLLAEWKALLWSYGKHISAALIIIPRQACCRAEAMGSIDFSLKLGVLWFC